MNYYMKLTNTGLVKDAAAKAGGDPVALAEMAIGDGGGNPVGLPIGDEIALVNEVYRNALSSLFINPNDATVMMAEVSVPAENGGWSVREVGIYDADGDLFAYGNFPETYKPTAVEGSTREMIVIVAIRMQSSDSVELVIDTSVVGATRTYVDNGIAAHKDSRDHPAATTTAKGFVEISTTEESIQGLSSSHAVPPSGLAAHVSSRLVKYNQSAKLFSYFMGQN